MGAESFETLASGKTADEAFARAVADALYEHGHRGYTGTIAEKSSYKLVATKVAADDPEPLKAAQRLSVECSKDPKHFSEDKFAPAACIEAGPNPKALGEKLFLFFGVASA